MEKTVDLFELRQRVINNPNMPEETKQELLDIFDDKILPSIATDTISKRVLSPDIYPDRFDFLLQHITKDKSIISNGSATNEPPVDSLQAKRVITDIPSWIKDGRYADLEMQQTAQEFIFNRLDIYSSKALMLQYSAKTNQAKGDIDYTNLPGVVMVVLMKKSPMVFRSLQSERYIHRVSNAVSDTGMKFPMLRNIAFVQLDKALEQFINNTYNEDEDVELLVFLSMIADINHPKVQEAVRNNDFLLQLYKDVVKCSESREVKAMLTDEELDILTMNSFKHQFQEEGREEGREELNSLYMWLYNQNRDEDAKKAAFDPEYRNNLLKEYQEKNMNS